VERPFSNASETTFFRRLGWSPEGSNLAVVNAVNGSQYVAALVSRDHWDSDTSLIGHTGPVEVTVRSAMDVDFIPSTNSFLAPSPSAQSYFILPIPMKATQAPMTTMMRIPVMQVTKAAKRF
jgi:hypothetical protein